MVAGENLYILRAALEMFSTISERRRPEKRTARKTSRRNMVTAWKMWVKYENSKRTFTFLLHHGDETKAFMGSSSDNLKMSFSVELMYKYQMQNYNC